MSELYNRDDIIEKNKEDLNFFASFCLPEVIIHHFPPFYEQISLFLIKQLLEIGREDVIFRFALSLPRGHAKTTFMKILVAYGVIHDLISFAIIICANEDRARDFLADVHQILLSSNVKSIYDNWGAQLVEDNKDTKRGKFLNRKIVLQAVGAGTSFRGIVKDNMRPDFILFDDAQSEKNAESEVEFTRLLKWVTGTAIKTRNPARCLTVWVGNMYDPPEQCILYHLSHSPQWTSLITGGILATGEALWPELHSVKALLEEYEHDVSLNVGHIWFAEVQNDPTAAPNRLLPDGDFPLTLINPDMEEIGAFITIDPAGNKKKSNDTVITGHVIYEGGKIEVKEIIAKILDPEKTISLAISMALRLNAPMIFPEGNAYQASLAFWMDKALVEFGLFDMIEVVPIINSSVKLGRIREFIKQILSGATFVTDIKIKAKILYQALSFKVEKSDNKDDILDCCAMGNTVRNKYLSQCLRSSTPLYSPIKSINSLQRATGVNPLTHLQSQRYSR